MQLKLEPLLAHPRFKHFKIAYFLLTMVVLFAISYRPNPEFFNDSKGYEEAGEQMTLSGCFIERPINIDIDVNDPERIDYFNSEFRKLILNKGKLNDCFLFFFRPFLFPLLLELAGDIETFNVFQNIVKVFAWTSFSFAMFYFPFHLLLRLFLYATVFFYYSTSLTYNNTILTEDLNLSFWVLLFAAFIRLMYKTPPPERLLRPLLAINGWMACSIFTRDSNFLMLLGYSFLMYAGLQFFCFKRQWMFKNKAVLGSLVLTVLTFATSQYSLNYTHRYEQFFSAQMDYHIGGEYYPKKLGSDVYHSGDRQWFFDNYPELNNLPHNTLAYRTWQIENIRSVWTHYVFDHLFFFINIQLGYMSGAVNQYGYLAYVAMLGLLLLILTIHRHLRLFLIVLCAFGVLLSDFFIALIGDVPGGFDRHINLYTQLIKFPVELLFVFALHNVFQSLAWVQGKLGSPWAGRAILPIQVGSVAVLALLSWGMTLGNYYWQKGISDYYNKNYDTMVEKLHRVVFFNNARGALNVSERQYHWLGQGYTALEDYAQAAEYYTKATEQAPHEWLNFFNRGLLYANYLNDLPKAVEDMTATLQRNPVQLEEVYLIRGQMWLQLQKLQPALEDFNASITIAPYLRDTYWERARTLFRLQQYEPAIADFTQYLNGEKNSNTVVAYFFRGQAYMQLRQFDAAIVDFTNSLDLNQSADAFLERGNAFLLQNKYQQAVEDLTRALAMNSGFVQGFGLRAKAYYALNQYDLALPDVERAIAANYRLSEMHDIRGLIYLSLNQAAPACQDLKKACELGNCDTYRFAQTNGKCPAN